MRCLTSHQFPEHEIVVHSICCYFGHIRDLKADVSDILRLSSLSRDFDNHMSVAQIESRTFLLRTTRTLTTRPNWEKKPFISSSPKPRGKCRMKRTSEEGGAGGADMVAETGETVGTCRGDDSGMGACATDPQHGAQVERAQRLDDCGPVPASMK